MTCNDKPPLPGWFKWFGATLVGSFAAVALTAVVLNLMPAAGPKPIDPEQPPRELMGWAGPEQAEVAWQQLAPNFQRFQIIGAQDDNAKKRVVAWEAAKAVNGGKHLPTFRQLIGDCVGAGAKQMMDYTQCISIIWNNEPFEFKPIFSPYHYAMGRNARECGAGRMGRDPSGSIGSWQAEAIRLYGVLPIDADGVPEYSKEVVSKWAVRLPADNYVSLGRQHRIETIARLKSAEEVRDAVCNTYLCTTASDWGGHMRPPTVDGKMVNKRADEWQHQMCIIGYDGTGREPLWYVLNSWGPDAHGKPPDDSPPGGFWVRKADVDYMCKRGEVFAFSTFAGFPARDWVIIQDAIGRRLNQHALDHYGAVAAVERN